MSLDRQLTRRLAAEQLADLVTVEKKIKDLTKELKTSLAASGTGLTDLPGVGPIVAARVLADVGDVSRFADRNRSRPGPAPHRSKPPLARPCGTGCREPATAG